MRVKTLRVLLPLLGIALGAMSAEAAQRSRHKSEEPPPPPPQFHVEAPTRIIALTRVASGLRPGATLGKFSKGCTAIDALASIPPLILRPSNIFGRLREVDFSNIFAVEANAAGYSIADTEKGNLFSEESATHAELEVGAAITQLTAEGCSGVIIIVVTEHIETSITVDWQVFDPLEKKMIYRASTTGHARIEGDDYNPTIIEDGTRAAFKDAARNILSDPNFVAAVTDNRATPTADNSGSRGVQIAQIPLHTQPFRDQVKELQKQVVTILTPRGDGSGFYIADGLLLTNQHVIEGFTNVKVRFLSGRELPARVLASNARRDIALVQTESVGVEGLALRLDPPDLTSQVFVIGSPLDPKYAGSISSGIVSAFRDHPFGPMIQSDVAVTHGNSGGPMFDDKGNVIGLTDLGIPGQDGEPTAVNLFIPIKDGLKTLNIELALEPGAAPLVEATPAPQQTAALSAPPSAAPATRQISVSMYPAAGPLKDGGSSSALAGVVAGIGTSGTFSFARPDGVACSGRWTTLQTKPESGSLVDKYQKLTGLPANVSGMVGGLAVGACSNSASFQAEYYAVPGADSGYGVATDSDGNIYKLIF